MEGLVTNPVVDYSNFHVGCENCGRVLSQVRDTVPTACHICGCAHYCSPECFLAGVRCSHRPQCNLNLDNEVDPSGAVILSSSQALWDLRRYTGRWQDELGDAAIAALNLHSDSSNIDKQALVVYLSYIPGQWRRMQRFRLHRAEAQPLTKLVGPSMDAAKRKRSESTIVNRRSGMVGCALIVLACNVPEVGLVFNSTFIGPEPDILVHPPPQDWETRLHNAVKGIKF